MKKKLAHIWEYYKFHIFITIFVVYVLCSLGYHFLNRNSYGLYMGFVNVVPGTDAHNQLVEEYSSCSIYTYENLLLTQNTDFENRSYSQASELKMLAAIEDKKLDIVIMDQEAYDTFVENDYLYNIKGIVQDQANLYTDYALDLSNYASIKDAGFSDKIYLGVIANSPRVEEVGRYLKTLN